MKKKKRIKQLERECHTHRQHVKQLISMYNNSEKRYALRFKRVCPVSKVECVCGGNISRSFNFCPHCGRELDFSGYNDLTVKDALVLINKANEEILTGGVADD